MASAKHYTVSQAAEMAHVTVRALHHYDEIGLLIPSQRSKSGYRLYDEADLQRLHQILLFRQLGFTLDRIREVLDDPDDDRRTALATQRELLLQQSRRTNALIRALDRALDALDRGGSMDTKKMFDGFEDFDPSQYEEEARERWGDTAAYAESTRRTSRYTKQDWVQIKAEADGVMTRMAELMEAGHAPDTAPAMDVAEQHRLHIDRWFYPCSHHFHSSLADMYTADPRFTSTFEKRATGLAGYMQAAIKANASR